MISVCIATYNGEKLIGEQLASILPQLGEEDEVIISDDHSSDGTLDVVRSMNSPIVRIVEGPCTGSLISNFENALKEAKGDYIFLSDQDDKWEPNKVEVMMHALQKSDCVVSDCYVTDGDWKVTSESFYALNRTKTGKFYNLLLKNGYLGCCMAMRRNVVERSLPFPKDIPMHDIWIGNIAAFHFRVAFVPERLIYFRRHDSNASVTARKSTFSLMEKLRFRWVVLKWLLKGNQKLS